MQKELLDSGHAKKAILYRKTSSGWEKVAEYENIGTALRENVERDIQGVPHVCVLEGMDPEAEYAAYEEPDGAS